MCLLLPCYNVFHDNEDNTEWNHSLLQSVLKNIVESNEMFSADTKCSYYQNISKATAALCININSVLL